MSDEIRASSLGEPVSQEAPTVSEEEARTIRDAARMLYSVDGYRNEERDDPHFNACEFDGCLSLGEELEALLVRLRPNRRIQTADEQVVEPLASRSAFSGIPRTENERSTAFIAFIGNGENSLGRYPANLTELAAAVREFDRLSASAPSPEDKGSE